MGPPAGAPSAAGPTSGLLDKVKGLPKQTLLICGGAVAAVILIIIVAVALLSGGGGGSGSKNSIMAFESEGAVFISGNNGTKFSVEGDLDGWQVNRDGSKAVLLTDSGSRGGTLWFVTTSKSYQIAEEVLGYQISASGNGIIYYTDFDSTERVASLYLYDTSSRNSPRLTDNAYYRGSGVGNACIAPTGKTVGYAADYDSERSRFTGYIKVGSKAAESLDNNAYAVAVSDNGRIIYYIKTSDSGSTLNVKRGNNDNRLISDVSSVNLYMNKDFSQAVFNYDGSAYITRNGGERQKISNYTFRGLVRPRGSQAFSGNNITVYGVSTFARSVAATSEGIIFIDNKFESARVTGTSHITYASEVAISNDGKTLLFLNSNSNLSVIDPTKSGSERREIAKNVYSFVASSDGKTVFFVNDDDELYVAKGSGTPAKISDDVFYSNLELSYNSNKVFFLVDYSSRNGGTLYFSNNGGKRTKVSGGDDIVAVWATPANMFYLNADQAVYRSGGNESFKLFQEDVSNAAGGPF
jgi:hypothetical protein